jgi:hypothetical protein
MDDLNRAARAAWTADVALAIVGAVLLLVAVGGAVFHAEIDQAFEVDE